jgi:hypothetical protein
MRIELAGARVPLNGGVELRRVERLVPRETAPVRAGQAVRRLFRCLRLWSCPRYSIWEEP